MTKAALLQATWYIDPNAGNDGNTGLTAGNAVKTYAEIVQRWGSFMPMLGQVTTINILGSLPATDPITLIPAAGSAVIQGTLAPIGPPLTLTSFTAKNKATGTPNRILVTGETWAPGTIVRDTTRSITMTVDQDLGSGSAQVTEPFTYPIPLFPTRATPVAGDSLQPYLPPTIFLNRIDSIKNRIGVPVAVFNCNVQTVDNGSAVIGVGCFLVESTITNNSAIGALGTTVAAGTPFLVDVWAASYFGSGAFAGTASIFGGALNGNGNNFLDGAVLDYDVLINGTSHYAGLVSIGSAYFAQWFHDTPPLQHFANLAVGQLTGGTPAIWGPVVIAIGGGQQLRVAGTTAVAALLATGGLTLDGLTTGYTFNLAAGTFSAGPVALTPASVDANGSLQSPRSGSRIFVQ